MPVRLKQSEVAPVDVVPADVSADQLLLIRIDGMHCHRCEEAIRREMSRHPGVHEVEVDFPSRQASVLFAVAETQPEALLETVRSLGYTIAGFTLLNPRG